MRKPKFKTEDKDIQLATPLIKDPYYLTKDPPPLIVTHWNNVYNSIMQKLTSFWEDKGDLWMVRPKESNFHPD